ncbi:hypothetical protein ACE193_19315 [Bernardetia sp. OM2101]|uniref:hypothetical protein n=1 Tax=Bernardetia sp. OM2101 TaxID=3344876 RepID=UPI0035D078D4
MKNKTILYFTSALLWLGVAFFSFSIYQSSYEQEIETIVESSTKIDGLHQEYYDLEYTWWERTKLLAIFSIDSRNIKTPD